MSIYHVKNNDPGSLKEYAQRHHGKGVNNEAWLRDVLATDWRILYEVLAPVSPHHDENERWHLVGTEVPIEGIGSIDILFVTTSGRPIIVETKLLKNPEARRDVVAQVAEYAVGLRRMRATQLLGVHSEDDVLSEFEMQSQIDVHLRAGRIDLLIVGDEIDDRALALGEALLDDAPTNQLSLWFVEIRLFEQPGKNNEKLLVPVLRSGKTIAVRHVVDIQVTVASSEAGMNVEYDVTTSPVEPPHKSSSRGPALTRQQLLTAIRSEADANAAATAGKLLDLAEKLGAEIVYRPKSASVRLPDPQGTKQKLTVFVITSVGTFYIGWTDRWESVGRVHPKIEEKFVKKLEKVLGQSPYGYAALPHQSVPLPKVKAHFRAVCSYIEEAVQDIRATKKR